MGSQTQVSEWLTKIQVIATDHPFMSLASLGVISIPYLLYKRYRFYTKVNVPLIPGIPFIGTPFNPSSYFWKMLKFHDTYSKTYQMYVLGQHYIFSSDPKFIKYILDHRRKYPTPDHMRRVFTHTHGLTMFTSEGEMWSQKHHTLAPLMSYKMLSHNFEVVLDMAAKLWSVIETDISDDRIIDLLPYMYRLTMDVIGTVAFGYDLEIIQHPEKQMCDKSGKIKLRITDMFINELDALNVRAFLPFEWMWNLPFPQFIKEKRAAAVLNNFFEKIIEQKKNSDPSEVAVDLVTLLLQAREKGDPRNFPYTHKDMLAECFSLFGGGQDTTARSLGFLLLELSRRPDIQAKIRQEIQQIAGDSDWTQYRPAYEDLFKMKYIDNVMKESLRFWPIAPNLFRMALEDDQYEGIHIPKGDNVELDVFSYQRNPEYFPDPEKFEPERWNDEKRHSKLYTFGMGARTCFGKKLGMTEIKLLMFTMLQKYEVVALGDNKVDGVFIFGLAPKGNAKVLLKRL